MSTADNKSLIRRYIAELNSRNTDVLDELVGAKFRETVRASFDRNVGAFPDYEVEIRDLIAEGDQVVVEWSYRGVHRGDYDGVPPTGRTINGTAISVYRIADGQIVDARGVWDRSELWQQLGLIPETRAIVERRVR